METDTSRMSVDLDNGKMAYVYSPDTLYTISGTNASGGNYTLTLTPNYTSNGGKVSSVSLPSKLQWDNSSKVLSLSLGDSSGTVVSAVDLSNIGKTYSKFTATTDGLVPAPTSNNAARFLKGDGTWATPLNTTYSNFKGATATTSGAQGLVPAPGIGTQAYYLKGDGTWASSSTLNSSPYSRLADGLTNSGVLASTNIVTFNPENITKLFPIWSHFVALSA